MRDLIFSFLTRVLPGPATHLVTLFLTPFFQRLVSQLLMWFAVLLSALLFLGLAGIALMLGLVVGQFHWVLVGVPAIALLLLVGAWIRAHQISQSSQIHRRDAAGGFAL
jgi:membrane protein implicated in regulation of membrane protease activity